MRKELSRASGIIFSGVEEIRDEREGDLICEELEEGDSEQEDVGRVRQAAAAYRFFRVGGG